MQLAEVVERISQIIKGKGPFGVPGQLHPLPGGEVRENLSAGLGDLLFDAGDFLFEIDPHRMGFGMLPEFFQLALQFCNRLLEIKLMFHRVGPL
jgi:hypothetical protein